MQVLTFLVLISAVTTSPLPTLHSTSALQAPGVKTEAKPASLRALSQSIVCR